MPNTLNIELKQIIPRPEEVINKILGTSHKLDQNFRLMLNLEKDVNRKLIKAIKFMKLPQLQKIYIQMSESDMEDVQDFIKHSFPHKLTNFSFDAYCNGQFQKIGNVYDLLGPVLDRVSNEISIQCVDADSEQINQIVKKSRQCNRLWL